MYTRSILTYTCMSIKQSAGNYERQIIMQLNCRPAKLKWYNNILPLNKLIDMDTKTRKWKIKTRYKSLIDNDSFLRVV